MSTTAVAGTPITGSRAGVIVTASTTPGLPAPALANIALAWQTLFTTFFYASRPPEIHVRERTAAGFPDDQLLRFDVVRASYANPFVLTAVSSLSRATARVVAVAVGAFTDELRTQLGNQVTLEEAALWPTSAAPADRYLSHVFRDFAPEVPLPVPKSFDAAVHAIEDTQQTLMARQVDDFASPYRWSNLQGDSSLLAGGHRMRSAVLGALTGQTIEVVDASEVTAPDSSGPAT